MKEIILSNIENASALESLYREDKKTFHQEFNLLYPEIKDNALATFWHERLNYESEDISWGSKNELLFIIIAALGAGFLAKVPEIFNINEEFFYPRNIGFIGLTFLTIYFIWKNRLEKRSVLIIFMLTLISALFINLLPDNIHSDTLTLSCIHLVLFLWILLGFTYTCHDIFLHSYRIEFLRYNGDLVIMSALLVIAGMILTAMTLGLFSMIGVDITKFYTEWIVVFGAAAIPLIATYLTQSNPQLVNKVSHVIAKIFSPLVLITLLAYLPALLMAEKDPYNDREFLMIFNALLIGVMAIILFSVAETSGKKGSGFSTYILLGLSVVTVIVNSITLSAILFRIFEWGMTPNRLAVLGGNILILANLFLVTYHLFRAIIKKDDIEKVENSISIFLPVYGVWTIIVTFIFPFIFNFK